MKIQPILELKGIRIELTLEEAEKIARSPVSGADRILKDVKMLVDLHHSQDNSGDIIPTVDPHTRLDGSKPAREAKKLAQKKLKRPKPEREPCEFCGGSYVKGRGMGVHLKQCDAKAKAEERMVKGPGILSDFIPEGET